MKGIEKKYNYDDYDFCKTIFPAIIKKVSLSHIKITLDRNSVTIIVVSDEGKEVVAVSIFATELDDVISVLSVASKIFKRQNR